MVDGWTYCLYYFRVIVDLKVQLHIAMVIGWYLGVNTVINVVLRLHLKAISVVATKLS